MFIYTKCPFFKGFSNFEYFYSIFKIIYIFVALCLFVFYICETIREYDK